MALFSYLTLSPTRTAAWIKCCGVGIEFHSDQHERRFAIPMCSAVLATAPHTQRYHPHHRLVSLCHLASDKGWKSRPPLSRDSAGVLCTAQLVQGQC